MIVKETKRGHIEFPDPVFDLALKEAIKEEIWKQLDTLTPREKEVLVLRFGLEDGCSRTLEEVGKVFHVTRECIRQIEAVALRRLRNRKSYFIPLVGWERETLSQTPERATKPTHGPCPKCGMRKLIKSRVCCKCKRREENEPGYWPRWLEWINRRKPRVVRTLVLESGAAATEKPIVVERASDKGEDQIRRASQRCRGTL